MQNRILVFRKPKREFHSIEKVFEKLEPHLNTQKKSLPYFSKGIRNRIGNIVALWKYRHKVIHVTGHDHYLLWFPFKKAILTIHDIEALKRKKGIRQWIFKKLWFDLPIRNARLITTISEFSKHEIQSLGPYKTPIKIVYNPLTISESPINSKEFNKSKPTILHLGVKPNKNLARLLFALKDISCTLKVIGKPQENMLQHASAMGVDLKYDDNVSETEIIKAYQAADLLAFVSTYEGFGLPIIEAQAMGCPVLTSNVASMPEIAGEGALFIDPFSVQSIKEGVLKIIEEDELRIKLIYKGRENIKRFNLSYIASQYIQLYEEIEKEG
jgi:glycosyltransferase involved in cell wall biosynthesis